jgi:hypothetical protein
MWHKSGVKNCMGLNIQSLAGHKLNSLFSDTLCVTLMKLLALCAVRPSCIKYCVFFHNVLKEGPKNVTAYGSELKVCSKNMGSTIHVSLMAHHAPFF